MIVDRHIYCTRCGYDLHGLVTRVCPECGKQFNPIDPSSYALVWQGRSIWIQVLSVFVTLWIGLLLGLSFYFMMTPTPTEFNEWAIAGAFLLVGISAFVLHYFRFRGTFHMCLAAVVAEVSIVAAASEITIFGIPLMNRRGILVATACTVVPWLLAVGISIALQYLTQARKAERTHC